MTGVDKCLKIALDKSVGDKGALAAFNMARKLTLSGKQSSTSTPSKDSQIDKYEYTCHAAELFSHISNLNRFSNKLDLEFNFEVSGSINSSCVSFSVKGASPSLKLFSTATKEILKPEINPASVFSGSSQHGFPSFYDAYFNEKPEYKTPTPKPEVENEKDIKKRYFEYMFVAFFIASIVGVLTAISMQL